MPSINNYKNYYLKADGTRYCDKTKQELSKMCFYPNGELNSNGLQEVLKILGYDYNPELVVNSYDFKNNRISPEKEFKLGKYIRMINLMSKNNIIEYSKQERTYFISYAAYSNLDGHFDLFNTIITIDEPITAKITESIENDLLTQIKDDDNKDSTYYAVQIISINKIN